MPVISSLVPFDIQSYGVILFMLQNLNVHVCYATYAISVSTCFYPVSGKLDKNMWLHVRVDMAMVATDPETMAAPQTASCKIQPPPTLEDRYLPVYLSYEPCSSTQYHCQ